MNLPEPSAGASAFPKFLDAFFAWYYQTFPVNATFIGVHDYDDRLPDYSERGIGAALAAIDTLLARVRVFRHTTLPERQELDRRLVEGFLEIQRWEFRSAHFHAGNPCVYTGEASFGVLALFLRPFAPLSQRVASAVARMLAIPALLQQGRENVRRAHPAWIARARRECAGALAFFERGVPDLVRVEAIQHPRFLHAADAAADAFRAFAQHLETALPHSPPGACACGPEALDLLLREGHFLRTTAGEIEALAEDRIAAARASLETHARALGAGSWREALSRLADRRPPTQGDQARYAQVWQQAREAADAHGLVTWVTDPISFVPQPVWAREAAPSLYFLFYRAPAAFDRLPVVDYFVTPGAHESAIKLTHVIHHAGLGHHLQNWYAYHRAASRVGQVAAIDCASRIAMFCGGTMAEGWACYATDVMEEIGFLDAFDQLALAHTRLRIAARAAVDVRLHTGRWTLEQAEACYRDDVGMSAEAARTEAVKNSMFPATALMYLVGTTLIHTLRRDLAGTLGFELRSFHDRLLSYGSVPVALASEAMTGAAPRW
ncbi:MAG: DUF885 domain-containing protein [Bacillati bacterium ANGP1]|uniref:DUF885 domain-containing protein n=1 Tax=Candidatus Segetimicrobium genomatis TaxID=2569760 RepID=A0A537LLG4_9BACT|nr:MAG: DUF885 domain-containing protein [Terrabacteria group bacterium ANGP1]